MGRNKTCKFLSSQCTVTVFILLRRIERENFISQKKNYDFDFKRALLNKTVTV